MTYKSEAFAREFGLPNLHIGFSGYCLKEDLLSKPAVSKSLKLTLPCSF
jgi:hypothetical protein